METIFSYIIEKMKAESEGRKKAFLDFAYDKLIREFDQSLMDKYIVKQNQVNQLSIAIPNASVKKEYNQIIQVPSDLGDVELVGLTDEEHGLSIQKQEDGKSFVIKGTPKIAGTFDLILRFKYESLLPDRPYIERKLQIIINPDPRQISDERTIPTNWEAIPEPKYFKEDTQAEYITVKASDDGTPHKDMVAASKRGRSHGWDGKPRDDHFKLKYMDNGWYIMAVADGAGSAKFSREGSRIACDTAVDYIQTQLIDNSKFEENIHLYELSKDDSESEARKLVGDDIYKIVGTAAYRAHCAINREAQEKNVPSKLYATTLLLTICKKFSCGWFIASFWVGDGAICLYDKNAHTAKLLGVPDEGEFAGQTRFLTMPEIFKDATSLYQRLRFNIVPDFTALFLMSDGVSDPMFETDANLNNVDKWDELWDNLQNNPESPVHLIDDNEAAKDELLKWLDFWVAGHHDDRTIAILY